MAAPRQVVTVGGRELSLSNLDKVLYPETGTTKGEVIEYYARIAPTMLPHLAGRALTFHRFPNGVEQKGFFEKRCAKHRPEWVATAPGPGDHNGTIEYCVIDEPASLVWAANMAALELHAPMALAEDLETPRMVVFDLDPGPPAAIRECARTALAIRDVLAAVDLEAWPKSSGSKGLQLYVPVNTPCTHDDAASFALAVGQLLEKQDPSSVLTSMTKAERKGKVFVDWSQNVRHKTTIAPYSMRARPHPTVSTPVTWDEVEEAADGATELRFLWTDVLERVEDGGDVFAPVLSVEQVLPGAR
ncbi:MAG: non-homologous end-joining DNA ligase [Acidimicrobiales bacterium]